MNFTEFYNDRIKSIQKVAKSRFMTAKSYLKLLRDKSLTEYKKELKVIWLKKECRSFWKSECENRGIECYRCCHYKSQKELTNKGV